jgi:hypothetical protein
MPLTNVYVQSDVFKSVAAELIANGKSKHRRSESYAIRAYGVADAMIKRREQTANTEKKIGGKGGK